MNSYFWKDVKRGNYPGYGIRVCSIREMSQSTAETPRRKKETKKRQKIFSPRPQCLSGNNRLLRSHRIPTLLQRNAALPSPRDAAADGVEGQKHSFLALQFIRGNRLRFFSREQNSQLRFRRDRLEP